MSFDGDILALDVATQTGWAFGNIRTNRPSSGSVRFGGKNAELGARLSDCRAWLADFIAVNPKTRLLVFEAPVAQSFFGKHTSMQATRLLIGLVSIVEEYATTHNRNDPTKSIDVREARVSDVRAHFLGSNRLKRDEAKRATQQKCRLLGWNPIDDNAADALALWSYQLAILFPENALRSTPLFQKIGRA